LAEGVEWVLVLGKVYVPFVERQYGRIAAEEGIGTGSKQVQMNMQRMKPQVRR
jgi:hypothetical protein